MKGIAFWQIILTILVIATAMYLLYPKYEFYYRVNKDGELCIYRANKITGIADVFMRDKPFNP